MNQNTEKTQHREDATEQTLMDIVHNQVHNKETRKRDKETNALADIVTKGVKEEKDIEQRLAMMQGYGLEEKEDVEENIEEHTEDIFLDNTEGYNSSEKHKNAVKSVLFLDIDDVVLNTGEAILDVLNARFELHGEEELKLEDIKEWNFYSILERINEVFKGNEKLQKKLSQLKYPIGKDYILEILEVPDFWVRVELAEGFNEMIEVALKYYEVILLTQGTYINLSNKVDYLGKRAQIDLYRKDKDSGRYCQFCGLDFKASKKDFINSEYMQEHIAGRFTVQIDDKYENLDSSCDLKILLKNHKDTDYNQITEHREDVYIMDSMKEIEDTLRFYAENDYRSIGKDYI